MAATRGKFLGNLSRQLRIIRDSRLAKPLFHVYVDYKNVFLELCSFAYKRPLRAATNALIVGAFGGVWFNNPDKNSYTEQLMENANTLVLLGNKVRNPYSTSYIEHRLKLHNENLLQVYDLGLFSVVLQKQHSDISCFYEAKCYYLQPRWIYMYKNIVDVGFLRRWYNLDKAMANYDVNQDELSALPE